MIIWNGNSHAVFALGWGIILHDYVSIIALIVGSLWPDCDIRGAYAARIFPLYKVAGIHHRGITHTVWALLTFSIAAWWLFNSPHIGYSFGAGYLMHLLADSTTPMGIRWFSVRKNKRVPKKVQHRYKTRAPHQSNNRQSPK